MTERREGRVVASMDMWEQDAACRGADTSLFFGPVGFEPKRERTAREAAAKELCSRCPVIEHCRRHALITDQPFGVWGGLGERERRSRTSMARRAG